MKDLQIPMQHYICMQLMRLTSAHIVSHGAGELGVRGVTENRYSDFLISRGVRCGHDQIQILKVRTAYGLTISRFSPFFMHDSMHNIFFFRKIAPHECSWLPEFPSQKFFPTSAPAVALTIK